MGRTVNNNKPTNLGFDDDNFLRDICLGRYVLVLGDDVILKPEYGSGVTTDYIVQECKNGLQPEERCNLEKGVVDMKTLIRKMLREEWTYSLDEISDSLKKLIKTRCFLSLIHI